VKGAPKQELKNRVYVWIVRLGTFFLKRMDVRRQVVGAQNVPDVGGVVLAITHFSYLDFVLSEWAIFQHNKRYTRFMATKKSFEHPIAGPLMSSMGHIPVDRAAGAQAYQFAVEALQRGEIVGVFPETRVSRSFTLLPFKTGAARMAQESGQPIVPCVIWGSHRVMTRTHKRHLRKSRHTPVSITFGEPIHVDRTDDVQAVTDKLRQTMADMLESAMDAYSLEPGAWWVPSHRGGSAPSADEAIALDERKAS
jgi:1-acyl-sn-glycerol-3-phosphate acyltransferase